MQVDMEYGDDLGDVNDKTLACETKKKLEKILWKILEPNFKIKNDLYLNLLLTHWIGKTKNGFLNRAVHPELHELFIEWIIEASKLWDENRMTPSSPVLLFALNVASHLSTDEIFFVKMRNNDVYGKLLEITRVNQDSDTSITVGYITLLSAVLEHASGVHWLQSTTYWNDVISIGLNGYTKYSKQKAYQFFIKLLETTNSLAIDFCEGLVEILVEPLNEAAVKTEFTKNSEVENRKLYNSLKPTLDFVSEVTNALLRAFNKNILTYFLEIETPEAIQNILSCSQIQEFSFDLLKIRFVFLFFELCAKLEVVKPATHDADTLCDIRVMFDLIQDEIEKGHVKSVIRICYYAHVLYVDLDNRVPLCIRKGESIEFQNQMMLFQLVPVLTLCHQFAGNSKGPRPASADDLRQDFYRKLAKISALKTIEISSRWHQRLVSKRDLIEDVAVSLQYILKSKKIMTKDLAALIFKPLVYSLSDVVCRMAMYRATKMPIRGIKYFNILIDLIIDLVETFDLTWKDSLETISVLDLACEIVQYEYVDYQVTVKFLQLLKVAISRCMSPNMVLLMDNTKDSVISQIGSLMYSKCYNSSHEIRINALEVVHTLALDASSKFPEFTNILLDAKLPQLVLEMALKDKEHQVRTTAIKCLQALIRLEDIWEVYTSEDNFWDNILNILINEPKGTVRKEAATLVYHIYKYNSFPDDVLPRVYDVMTHAAIGDIHWEVKCNSLAFWSCTLLNHLQDKGMSDRRFPPYLFSKEKKKIVPLTQPEIDRRVIRVVNELSEIGCLYVIKTAIQDEFDEEVSKVALNLARQMVKMFRAHKITCDNVDLSQPPTPSDSSSQTSSLSPSSSDNQASPARRFSSESSQSQYPDSPGLASRLGLAPSPVSPGSAGSSPDYNGPSTPNSERTKYSYISSLYTAPPSPNAPNTQYSDASSPYSTGGTQKHDDIQSNVITEKLEPIDFFDTACKEEDILMLESDVDLELALTENMENPVCSDMAETEKMFEDLLKLNDATLLEEIYNSGCEVTAPKIETRKWMQPSEYVKFCFEVVANEHKKTNQFIHDLEELDSLLDDLLKEYDLNTTDQIKIKTEIGDEIV